MNSSGALDALPAGIIATLAGHFPDFMLIGAHARDHIVVSRAHRLASRLTRDLDIAISVPSLDSYGAATANLEPTGTTGMAFKVVGRRFRGVLTTSVVRLSPPTLLIPAMYLPSHTSPGT